MGILDDLSQMRFPEPFRIGPPVWPEELRTALEKVLRPPASGEKEMDVEAFLLGMGSELFRLRQKMLKPGTTEPQDEMKRAYRHFEALWDFLAQSQVEILDHTGNRYAGQDLEAIAFEPAPGINRETVIETVRPSIYYKGRMIQRGQVVVGKPEFRGGGPSNAEGEPPKDRRPETPGSSGPDSSPTP